MRGDTGFIHEEKSKSVAQYKGNGHTLYVERVKENHEDSFEVWFEDFCILGSGPTVVLAMKDAEKYTEALHELVSKTLEEISK